MANNNIDNSGRKLLRNFLIELILYGILVFIYFIVVLRFLGDPLQQLFTDNLTYYAFAGLGLIVVQGFVLDVVATYLLDLIGLDRLE